MISLQVRFLKVQVKATNTLENKAGTYPQRAQEVEQIFHPHNESEIKNVTFLIICPPQIKENFLLH